MEIREIDVLDRSQLAAWFDVEVEAISHDRPHAVSRTFDALVTQVTEPNEYHESHLLAASEGGVVVGIAELGYSLQDNPHLADLEVTVRPEHRRRGIGRALYAAASAQRRAAGRTSAFAEVNVVRDEGPLTFARAMGGESVHEEDHLMLDLPLADERVRELTAKVVNDYEIVTWQGRCPDELIDAYAEMRTQMNQDVPVGELDWEAVVMTPERIRAGEARLAKSYDIVVAAARRADGVLGGYSLVYLAHGSDQVWQDDTLVMPDHRGHRLGLALKLATYAVIVAEHPERVSMHTWTDPENRAMCATNTAFGYRPVERMHEVQVKD
ncbi:MAG: GNAT family N-acetyltransferase [Nocardioides sp.]|uniref:GNAT family N-acetyltransferase n=1 Tax=Nocardioides sp. TaxID=35761 RepID=UPI0032635546